MLRAMSESPMFLPTYRWNDGASAERYEAVEVRRDGLFWYAWSHVHGVGRTEEATQSFEAFLAEGPLRPMPAFAREELEAFVRRATTPARDEG
jgi:hypothetical protein